MTFASILLSQTIEWSEPVRLDDFGGASSPNIICDKFGRLWASWAEGDSLTGYRTRAKYLEDDVWHDAGTFWEGFGYRPDCIGTQGDSTIWVFNESSGGGIRAAYYKSGVWYDTLTIDHPLIGVYNCHSIEDENGNLWLIYTQNGTDAVRWTVYDGSTWSSPITFTPGYILDAIIDINHNVKIIWQSHPYVVGGMPTATIFTSFFEFDSFSTPESLFRVPYPVETIYPTGYLGIDNEVFLAGCYMYMDSIATRTIRAYSYHEGLLDSAYLDTVTGPYLPGKYTCVEKKTGKFVVLWYRRNVGEIDKLIASSFDGHDWIIPEQVFDDSIYVYYLPNIAVDGMNRIWLVVCRNIGSESRAVFCQYIIDTTYAIFENRTYPQTPIFNLTRISPNPFNDNIRIDVNLYATANTNLRIYDISGKLISTLQNGNLNRGTYSFTWRNIGYPSGLYFVKLSANHQKQIKKVILIK